MSEPRTIEQIIEDVAKAAGISFAVIYQPFCRTPEISLARHVAVYMAKKETKLSFKYIARKIGFADHKGAINAFNRVSCDLAARREATVKLFLVAGGKLSDASH